MRVTSPHSSRSQRHKDRGGIETEAPTDLSQCLAGSVVLNGLVYLGVGHPFRAQFNPGTLQVSRDGHAVDVELFRDLMNRHALLVCGNEPLMGCLGHFLGGRDPLKRWSVDRPRWA
jgi:hypothetical protein